jgi:hypothetical protein
MKYRWNPSIQTTMSKIFLAFLSVVLVTSLAPSSIANERKLESESWVTPDRYDPGFQGILVSDLKNAQQLYSRLEASSSKPVNGSVYGCRTTKDPGCSDANSYWFNALLPICDTSIRKDCVTSITATSADGVKHQATFLEYVYPNHPNSFIADDALKIPEHAQPSIWNIPSVPHKGGTRYALIAGLNGTTWPNAPRAAENFYAHLLPVQRVVTGWPVSNKVSADGFFAYFPQCITKSPGARGEARVGCMGMRDQGIGDEQYRCALWIDKGSDCYIQRPFPNGLTFTLDFRLASAISGWLHGRLGEPEIRIQPGSDGATELSISAEPIEVPIYYAGDLYQNLPSPLKDLYEGTGSLSKGAGYGRICCEVETDPLKRNSTSTPHPFGDDSIDELSHWLKNQSDQAAATPSMWSVRSMASWELSQANSCFTVGKDLKGIVTTNSATYSDGPPRFVDGSLNYRVASPHLRQDGQTFQGTYDLVVRSDVARCLYGYSTAPVSAEIEIVSDSGVESIATSVLGEKQGWLFLSVRNFTFSAPTIRARLVQAKVDPVPSASESTKIQVGNVATKKKSKSVTLCVQGSKTKKVESKTAKCPRGYKKQAAVR